MRHRHIRMDQVPPLGVVQLPGAVNSLRQGDERKGRAADPLAIHAVYFISRLETDTR
jgi:hypothetical protein